MIAKIAISGIKLPKLPKDRAWQGVVQGKVTVHSMQPRLIQPHFKRISTNPGSPLIDPSRTLHPLTASAAITASI